MTRPGTRGCSASSCVPPTSWPGSSWSAATCRARSATAHQGVARAEEKGLGLAPYGLDLQYLHYLAHSRKASGITRRSSRTGSRSGPPAEAEARLSAMALFVEVGQGNPVVGERRAWLEPFWAGDRFGEYIARGLLAEHALWRGDPEGALGEVAAALATQVDKDGYGPPVIRVAAIGLSAHAEPGRAGPRRRGRRGPRRKRSRRPRR